MTREKMIQAAIDCLCKAFKGDITVQTQILQAAVAIVLSADNKKL